jgi:hypothetical protein
MPNIEHRSVMSPDPRDTPLPISYAAVVGVWINDTPMEFENEYILRLLTRLTLAATGEASMCGESTIECDGRQLLAAPTVITHAGTWTLENDIVVLYLPSRRTPRDELMLVQRIARDGLTRIVLKTSGGGVFWRPEAT